MNWLNKLERKIGRFALHNLSLGLIICYVFGYLIQMLNADFIGYLTLNPYLILHGQVWRLVSWILIPPESLDFFTIIMLFFYYTIGTSLERTWGAFRYNLYFFSGMLFTIIGSFVLMGYLANEGKQIIEIFGSREFFAGSGRVSVSVVFGAFSTYFINMSIYLAYAATFPDSYVYLMFVLPIKIKYLGIVYGAMVVYQFIQNGIVGRIVIGASLLNFVVFFLLTRNYKRISPQEIHRRQAFKNSYREGMRSGATSVRGNSVITRHKCAVCGRTELDDDMLEFRFCSKCDGNYEYCSEHLFTHTHVHSGEPEEH